MRYLFSLISLKLISSINLNLQSLQILFSSNVNVSIWNQFQHLVVIN